MIGFSTGAIALGDFRKGLELVSGLGLPAIELSALRESELEPLVLAIDSLDLSGFSHISLHAPNKIALGNEQHVIDLLFQVKERGWPIIVHPNIIQNSSLWIGFGSNLCIENMDVRRFGRTYDELLGYFNCFPEATFVLDLAHSRQCDPTMILAKQMIEKLKDRLVELHISEVAADSHHIRLSSDCVASFQGVIGAVPESVISIMESPCTDRNSIIEELELVRGKLINTYSNDGDKCV